MEDFNWASCPVFWISDSDSGSRLIASSSEDPRWSTPAYPDAPPRCSRTNTPIPFRRIIILQIHLPRSNPFSPLSPHPLAPRDWKEDLPRRRLERVVYSCVTFSGWVPSGHLRQAYAWCPIEQKNTAFRILHPYPDHRISSWSCDSPSDHLHHPRAHLLRALFHLRETQPVCFCPIWRQ